MKYLPIILLVSFYFSSTDVIAQVMDKQDFAYINYIINSDSVKVVGEGVPGEESRAIDLAFNEVVVGNGMQAFFTSDKVQSVRVVAQKDILPLISMEVINNSARLATELSAYKPFIEEDKNGYLPFMDLKVI